MVSQNNKEDTHMTIEFHQTGENRKKLVSALVELRQQNRRS
jgi:hypothetical protein